MKTSFALALLLVTALRLHAADLPAALASGEFRWQTTLPLVSPASRPDDPCFSITAMPQG